MKKLDKLLLFRTVRISLLVLCIIAFRHSFSDLTLLSSYYPDSYILFFLCMCLFIDVLLIPFGIIRKIVEKRKEKVYNVINET